MPQPYLRPLIEIDFILQTVYFRDDNFNSGWTVDAGVTVAALDGDTVALSGTTATNGYSKATSDLGAIPFAIVRAKIGTVPSGTTLDLFITATDASTQTSTITLTNNWQVFTISLFPNLGKHANNYKFRNQSNAGTIILDYIAGSSQQPIVLTKQDLDPIQINNTTSAADDVSFNLRNTAGKYTVTTPIGLYSTLYVYTGYLQDDTSTKVLKKRFGGTVSEVTPDQSKSQDILKIHGQGWAQALLNVYALKEYGSQSINNSINTMTGAITDIISTVNAGQYQLTTAFIQSFANNALTYIIFKTEPAFNCIKQLCDLLTSNNDANGTTTQPVEFWVDPAENCHLAPLGNWGTDPFPSTYPNALNVGRDQISNSLTLDMQHMVNQVHFWSITVKPPDGDAWTETVPANTWGWNLLGGSGGTINNPSYDNSASNFRVGTQAITASWSGATSGWLEADIGYNAAVNLGLDLTKQGGRIVPPRLKFYAKCTTTPFDIYAPQVVCLTTVNDKFLGEPLPLGSAGASVSNPKNSITNSDWHLWEYNLGPYGDRFVTVGNPNWNNINQIIIAFQFVTPKIAGQVWIDGMRIDGQTHYVAKNGTKIGQYGLRESHLVNHKIREPSELQLLAKAELFRSQNVVRRGTITVPGLPDILPGQKITVTAPSANLTSATLRVLEARHRFGTGEGYVTELDVTDDLTNYQALSPVSLSNMLLEMPISKTVKRREDYDVGLEKPDPTNATTTVDYPS